MEDNKLFLVTNATSSGFEVHEIHALNIYDAIMQILNKPVNGYTISIILISGNF